MTLAPTATDRQAYRAEVLACAAASTVGPEECVRLHLDQATGKALRTARREGEGSTAHREAVEQFKGALLALNDVRGRR